MQFLFHPLVEDPMKFDGRFILTGFVLTCALAANSFAGVSPYFRFDYGGSGLRMADGNKLIQQNENVFKAAGFPAAFQKIGPAYGPSASVGLWLFHGLRVGGMYSYQRSVCKNRLHVPGQLFYAQDLEFTMTEIGGEAAVRVTRLAGLTVGAHVAKGRGVLTEGLSYEDLYGQFYEDASAHRSRTTYGGFIGFDQTSIAGVAGYVRAGFQYRDMGRMPSNLTLSDGTTTSYATSTTIPLDYSGFYFKVGIGYDGAH